MRYIDIQKKCGILFPFFMKDSKEKKESTRECQMAFDKYQGEH